MREKCQRKHTRYLGADAEPLFVVEAATYLAQRKKLDWMTNKKEYLTSILTFSKDSSVRAKKSLLQQLVEKINEEEEQQQQQFGGKSKKAGSNSITNLMSSEDLVADSWLGLLKEMGAPRPKEMTEEDGRRLQLVSNLSVLIDAEEDESSAGVCAGFPAFRGMIWWRFS